MPAIPWPRPVAADIPGCEGRFTKLGRPLGLCHACERYGHNGTRWTQPAAFIGGNGTWDCPNHRPLLSADQIAATDEMMGHDGTVRASTQGGKSADRGGVCLDITRAGEA